jgi:hypothetical protein
MFTLKLEARSLSATERGWMDGSLFLSLTPGRLLFLKCKFQLETRSERASGWRRTRAALTHQFTPSAITASRRGGYAARCTPDVYSLIKRAHAAVRLE